MCNLFDLRFGPQVDISPTIRSPRLCEIEELVMPMNAGPKKGSGSDEISCGESLSKPTMNRDQQF